ncbi:MAG: hypothetical protein JKX69_12230 [Rhodobacteraceae bacterium]|nr:hypothetical protein [Paracoccaceae bacterium]
MPDKQCRRNLDDGAEFFSDHFWKWFSWLWRIFVSISITSFWEKLERKSLKVNPISRFYKAKTPKFFASSNAIVRVPFLLHGLAMIVIGVAIILTGGFIFI